MSDSVPTGHGPENVPVANTAAERNETSSEQIQVKGKAETAAVQAAQAAEAADTADLQPMMDWVMAKADLVEQTCFGVDIPDGMLPVEVAELLCRIKTEKGLPLESLPDPFVGKLLGDELALARIDEAHTEKQKERDIEVDLTSEMQKSATEQKSKTEEISGARTAYRSALERYADKSNAEKIPLLANDPGVPEAERAKLAKFAVIMQMAAAVPADREIIAARLNSLNMSRGVPDPIQFIQTAIFSSPDFDSGISQATQNAIAAEFKLTPRRIVTGSDYEGAMAETTTDAEGNEVPVFSEDKPLEFGLGLAGYPSANGAQEFMRATPTHGHAVTLDVTKMSPAAKGVAASYLGMWKAAEDAGETDFLLEVTQFDIRGQAVLDEAALYRAARIANYTFGGRTGYDGEIVRGNDAVGMMQWQAQLRSPKSDAGRSDRNSSDTRANLQGLGIMDAEGRVDEDVLKAFGDYSRENWFGAPEYQDVQAHLQRLFPDKFDRKIEGLQPQS